MRFFDKFDGFETLVFIAIAAGALCLAVGVSVEAFFDHCTTAAAMEKGYEQQIAPTPGGSWERIWVKSKQGEKAERP